MKYENTRSEFKILRYKDWFIKELENYDHCKTLVERITDNGTLLTGFELHHIIRLSNGGTNKPNNIIWIPTAIHRLIYNKEYLYNTREKVLKFCNEYITNEKEMSIEKFNEYIINNMFDRKKYWLEYRNNNENRLNNYMKKYQNNNWNKLKNHQQKYHSTKIGRISQIKKKSKQCFKECKQISVKSKHLFRYQCMCNINKTENIYWEYKQNKIIWI